MKAYAARNGVAALLWLFCAAGCAGTGERPAGDREADKDRFADVVHAVSGEVFRIHPGPLPAEKAVWRMAALPGGGLLRLKSKAPGPGGEVWAFEALSPGVTVVEFSGVLPDEEGGVPVSWKAFKVVIHPSRDELEASLAEVFLPVIDRRLEGMGSPRAGKVEIERSSLEGRHARVEIRPRNPELSGRTTVFLEKAEGRWRVLGMGSGFEPDFFEENEIPSALIEGCGDAPEFLPLSEAVCSELAGVVAELLGLEPEVEEARFEDHLRGGKGRGCRIVARGGGGVLPGPGEIALGIGKALEDLGWDKVPAYRVDGPMGRASGFEKGGQSALLRVVVEPSEEAGLLSTCRPSVLEFLPEELVYTVILDAARRP